jgi:hypothetical protein
LAWTQWTPHGLIPDWQRVASSGDGTKLVAVDTSSDCTKLVAATQREIPSFADWVKAIRPEPWMGRGHGLEGVDDPGG